MTPKKNKLIILFVLIWALTAVAAYASEEQAFIYNSKNKRDPFIPLVTQSGVYAPGLEMAVESVADISLEGTMIDPQGGSLAIINGQILRLGDQIGIFKIIKIEAARVIVSAGEREYIINLSSE